MFLIPELGTIIWMSIIFLIIAFILGKFAWKPLLKALADREKSVDSALKAAEEAKILLKNLEQEKEKIREESQRERERLIAEGNSLREKLIEDAREKAHVEAEKVIADARLLIERERKASFEETKKLVGELSMEIAAKIIKTDLSDAKRHQELISKLINDIELN